MGLASVIYNGVQAPLKFDSLLVRFSLIQAPKFTSGHFCHSHNHTFLTGLSLSLSLLPFCLVINVVVNVLRFCVQEEPNKRTIYTPQVKDERGSSQLSDSIKNLSKSSSPSAVDNQEKPIQGHEGYKSSVKTVALCVGTAVAFGLGVGLKDGVGKATEFFAGYILEQSLSVDNLFVFVLVFNYFKVPFMYQNRVLSYGIAGAIIFRLSLILLGAATLQRFEVVNLFLAAILLYSAFKLFASEDDDSDLSENFIVKTCQRFIPVTSRFIFPQCFCQSSNGWFYEYLSRLIAQNVYYYFGNEPRTYYYDGNRFFTNQDVMWKVSVKHFGQATPLLLTVAVIELSDIAFAVDSIPAVFGVTRDPFIVFTSNLFAILGLRSFYTLISEGMAELEYLQPSIAVVLGFIGCKMILDYFGFHVSTEASLGVVATCLSAGVVLSLMKKSD
ncbi:hypothetical protein EZV62_016921 [Acer yangbiense]|uniref:Thylakoid membrane protein TERC, chloroplastic n=1 Tax=Acer yangbiense TaxID=1000413 RepID=A0A5C7HSE9_9ROSI|nr:hypothetical protein EZV62_016921 [Acer yangbiense]